MADWTETDIPDQSGRVALVTGANSGIGLETVRALAQHGAHVVMACRSRSKADAAATHISDMSLRGSVEVLDLDLADLDSVADAAATFARHHDRLDLLINNAGMMATPKQRTAQGLEWQLGINHFGHYALAGHLLPQVAAVPGSRVVTVSSIAHKAGVMNWDDLNAVQSYEPWPAYRQSKLANLLFMRGLQSRLEAAGLAASSLAAHPGISATNLGDGMGGGLRQKLIKTIIPAINRFVSQPAEMGALPTLRAATDLEAAGGEYFGPDGKDERAGHPVRVEMTYRAMSDANADRLWSESERLTGVNYLFH